MYWTCHVLTREDSVILEIEFFKRRTYPGRPEIGRISYVMPVSGSYIQGGSL
jgi:hypothetical protein